MEYGKRDRNGTEYGKRDRNGTVSRPQMPLTLLLRFQQFFSTWLFTSSCLGEERIVEYCSYRWKISFYGMK
ncbi:hypothetical protein AB5N19_10764 [Seiridium cardinale]